MSCVRKGPWPRCPASISGQGDMRSAQECAELALEADPANVQALVNKVRLLLGFERVSWHIRMCTQCT